MVCGPSEAREERDDLNSLGFHPSAEPTELK